MTRQSRRSHATEAYITTVLIIIYKRPTDAGGREHVS